MPERTVPPFAPQNAMDGRFDASTADDLTAILSDYG
jgi:hypothetical protein